MKRRFTFCTLTVCGGGKRRDEKKLDALDWLILAGMVWATLMVVVKAI